MLRPSFPLLLLGSLSACPPVPLDPIVTDSGVSTGDPTGGDPGATDGMSGALTLEPTTNPASTDASTTQPVDDTLQSTGAPDTTTGGPDGTTAAESSSSDDSSGRAVTITTGDTTSDATSDATSDTASEGTTAGTTDDGEDTALPLLDPCPMTGPMIVDVSGSSPSGAFAAVQGVFAWQGGNGAVLIVHLVGEPVDIPNDFVTTHTDKLTLQLKSFAGEAPEFWIDQEIFANVAHEKTPDQHSDLNGITIPIDAMTLEVWSVNWEDYDNEPILGGHFSLQQPGWDLEGVFEVPYCHELSGIIPI
jgi:hypothetical protein